MTKQATSQKTPVSAQADTAEVAEVTPIHATEKSAESWYKTFWAWATKPGYSRGVIWAVLISLTSATNDVFAKFLGERLNGFEVIFFRFLFSLISLVPFLMYKKGTTNIFKTNIPGQHIARAVMGFVAMASWGYSLIFLELTEVSTLFLTTPLFFLPLAVIFLKEHVGVSRWIATLLGFAGVYVIVRPTGDIFNLYALIPLAGSLIFAGMDVLNKKMIATESQLTLLFYFALGTTLVSFIPMLFYWQTPTLQELAVLATVGVGANLIQVCIFNAFSATEASALAPFRYVELVFAATFGYLFFSEVPKMYTLIGAALIIAGTFYIAIAESKK